MRLPPLCEGRLLRRYKRFLADVELDDGSRVTAHCPNPGSMITCMEEGGRVLLSRSDDPRRKLAYTWELSRMGGTWVLVNTARTNPVVREALEAGSVPELAGYPVLQAEVPAGEGSRLDFRLEAADRPPCWVEVKNVTLVEGGVAWFPDAVTLRGQRHLVELARLCRAGARAVLLLVVSRADADRYRPARAIDPDHADCLAWAVEQGVEVLAYRCAVGPRRLCLAGRLPVELDATHLGPLPRGRATPNRARGSWRALVGADQGVETKAPRKARRRSSRSRSTSSVQPFPGGSSERIRP